LGLGYAPNGIAIDNVARRMFVSDPHANIVHVYDITGLAAGVAPNEVHKIK
jgi:sugar lactone lactonase YvrE